MSSTIVLFTFGDGVCLTSHLKCIYQLHACCCFKHYLKRSTGICGLGNRVMVTPWGPRRFRTCQVTRAQLDLWELHLPYNREQKLQEGLAVLPVTAGVQAALNVKRTKLDSSTWPSLAGGNGHSPGTQFFLGGRCRWPETEGIWGVVSE